MCSHGDHSWTPHVSTTPTNTHTVPKVVVVAVTKANLDLRLPTNMLC